MSPNSISSACHPPLKEYLKTPRLCLLKPPPNIGCANCGDQTNIILCCSICYIFGRHKLPELFKCFYCSSSCYNTQKSEHQLTYHQFMENFPHCLSKDNEHQHTADMSYQNSDTESEHEDYEEMNE